MKIFNWVHRRFNHKDEVGQDEARKTEVNGNAKEQLALLENAAFDSVFDGWEEGILTIGTLGFDPALLKDFKHEDESYLYETNHTDIILLGDQDQGADEEGEMKYPLVSKACNHASPQCDEISEVNDHEEDGFDTDMVKKETKTGERITLADLFWADSEKNMLKNKKLADDQDHVKAVAYHTTESNTKHALNDHDKVGLISKKKLTKEDAARPIKKINRIVRKMLKKKIHPDVENQKETARMKPMRISAQ